MATNTFVPTSQKISTPIAGTLGTALPTNSARAVAQQQASFEWFDYGQYIPGQGTTRWETNPPFKLWDGEKLIGALDSVNTNTANGVPGHILRGYIRRAEYNVSDRPSTCRLQFLYNPTEITRQYVSYLDQGALDPFNSVYQSGNLVAPPSFMDFNFQLLFDRQEEATEPNNPGVLIDMDYFDLVVRNVVPTSARQNNALPDNGLMMVNPRDITVVFSPSLSVQGRPTNAQVVFEKFTHRMTPTRMTIAVTMRVVYLGPVRDLTTFVNEQVNVARRVPFNIPDPVPYDFHYNKLEWESNGEDIDPKLIVNIDDDQLSDLDGAAGTTAVQIAHDRWKEYDTHYSLGSRNDLWKHADCSSFVWGGFADMKGLTTTDTQSMAERLGWPNFETGKRGNIPDVSTIFSTLGGSPSFSRAVYGGGLEHGLTDGTQFAKALKMEKGDILIRFNHPDHPATDHSSGNHIGFVWDTTGNPDDGTQRVTVLHAAAPPGNISSLPTGVGFSDYSQNSKFDYNFGFRVSIGYQGATQDVHTSGGDDVSQAAGKPSVPQGVTGAEDGTGGAQINWNNPKSDGGSKILNYTIKWGTYKASLNHVWKSTGPTNTHKFSAETLGVPDNSDAMIYFKVAAINALGTGPYSDSIAVIVTN